MSFKKLLAVLVMLLMLSSRVSADGDLLFEIRIPAEVGAQATATGKDGVTHDIGTVLALPKTTRYPSYSASAWGNPGEVCASAVNAIHMLVSVEDGKGRTMSIIPEETIAPAAGVNAAFVLSAAADSGIFGAWAPPSGTEVFVLSPDGTMEKLGKTSLPKRGDNMLLRVYRRETPYFVEIENRPGGRVIAWDTSGYRVIARVLRRVAGTGRFEGTLFQSGSRLRANHPGVLDFSTAGRGAIGGFQIIPWDHALDSKEMQGAWDMSQWMIIGAADGASMLGGSFPLFSSGLVPGPSEEEKLWDIWSTYGRRSLVLVRLNGGGWQFLPKVSGRADDGLKDMTHLRIYFPVTDEPLKR